MKKTLIVQLYIIFWAVLFISFGAIISNRLQSYSRYKAEEQSLSVKVAEQKAKNERLKADLANAESDENIERLARTQLGLIRDDEILFYTK